MKLTTQLLALALTIGALATQAHAGGADFVARQTVSFKSSAPENTLAATSADLRDVFERFQPAVDSGMTITQPKRVSGPAAAPVLQFSVQKCVLVICKDADLYAEVTMRQVAKTGSCSGNYRLVADLHRSSETLSSVYSALNVDICFNKTATGGSLVFNASAVHAPSYEGGVIQQQIFSVLKLQVSPMISAINESLAHNAK